MTGFAGRRPLSLPAKDGLLGVTLIAPTVLIFVEKEPPHEVRVVSLANPLWALGGEGAMRRAIGLYADVALDVL